MLTFPEGRPNQSECRKAKLPARESSTLRVLVLLSPFAGVLRCKICTKERKRKTDKRAC